MSTAKLYEYVSGHTLWMIPLPYPVFWDGSEWIGKRHLWIFSFTRDLSLGHSTQSDAFNKCALREKPSAAQTAMNSSRYVRAVSGLMSAKLRTFSTVKAAGLRALSTAGNVVTVVS